MFTYAKEHWRGELSLAQSYWVNGMVLTFLVYVGVGFLEPYLSSVAVKTAAISGLLLIAGGAAITIWQFVGIWRSATNSERRTGRLIWPRAAKMMVVLGWIGALGKLLDPGRWRPRYRGPPCTRTSIQNPGMEQKNAGRSRAEMPAP